MWSATGSFVPVYKGWIEYLNSLLPLLHGIDYLEHKNYILQEIEKVRKMIAKEEIDNFITG